MSRVLCVYAHMDDEALLCGGTIAGHVAAGDEVRVLFMTDSVSSREGTTREDAYARLHMCNLASTVLGYNGKTLGWNDQKLDTYPILSLQKEIEKEIQEFQPDRVYTHWDKDVNDDHARTARACMVACRKLGELYMSAPVWIWNNPQLGEGMVAPERMFKATNVCDVTEHLEKKQQALDCYRDELGPVEAGSLELFEKVVAYNTIGHR